MSSVSNKNYRPQRNYWPYDELTISKGQSSNQFVFKSPWMSLQINVGAQDIERVNTISEKLNSGSVGPEDLPEVTWLFSGLSQYALAYALPLRESPDDSDKHTKIKLDTKLESDWKWDHESTLALSQTTNGYDPITLFSAARRFHLLDALESNKTADLSVYVKSLSSTPEKFKTASALVVRQNHYVTQKCDESLRPALKVAQRAEERVRDFMQAEAGHDAILGKAIKSLAHDPETVPVIEPAVKLMELFKEVAGRNFLAFSMIVDMFERSSYQEHDPLAQLLAAGGEEQAAKQIDIHKDINDSGGHENVAIGFLEYMSPVDQEYAIEALQYAELVTNVMHQVSSALLEKIKR